jgi:hypothetical protein
VVEVVRALLPTISSAGEFCVPIANSCYLPLLVILRPTTLLRVRLPLRVFWCGASTAARPI